MIIDSRNTAIVFDDHKLFSDSLSALIERLGLFHSVHTLSDTRELTNFLIGYSKERIFLFLDFYLEEQNSLPLINEVRRMSDNVKIVMLSSVTNWGTIAHIMSYRPNAFISKTSGLSTVLSCISAVSKGKTYLCPVITEIMNSAEEASPIPFTAREMDMLYHFSQGNSIQETAEKAHLSKHTVVSHRRRMMEKTNSKSITELLAYARKLNII